LRKYYDTQGKGDHLLIDLPKGHYSPTFAYATARKSARGAGNGDGATAGGVVQPSPAVEGGQVAASLPPPLYRIQYTKIALAALVILSLALGFAAFYYRSQLATVKGSRAGSKDSDSKEAQSLAIVWKDFVDSSAPILVTYSNTAFLGSPQQG